MKTVIYLFAVAGLVIAMSGNIALALQGSLVLFHVFAAVVSALAAVLVILFHAKEVAMAWQEEKEEEYW